jgi:hypothetical protein
MSWTDLVKELASVSLPWASTVAIVRMLVRQQGEVVTRLLDRQEKRVDDLESRHRSLAVDVRQQIGPGGGK